MLRASIILGVLLIGGCAQETPQQHRENLMLRCQQNGSNALDCAAAIQQIRGAQQ